MRDLRAVVRTPFLLASPLDRYRGVTSARRHEHPHAVLISEGADAHFAIVFGPLAVDEFLELTAAFFDAEAFEVTLESESAETLETYLVDSGWSCVEEELAMVLTEITTTAPPPPPSVRIERVERSATYEDYMTVVPGNRAWVPSLEAATDPNVGLFVGYADERPVATSRLTCYGDVAEITGVQTLPEFRRRGYGRALTWAAIEEVARRGCHTVMLTATSMGYPLYLDMGFEEVCAYRTYEPPS